MRWALAYATNSIALVYIEGKMVDSKAIFQGAQSVALIGNGVIVDYDFMAPLVRKYDKCIAVDGGLSHCHAMGIIPDLIIGDQDSLSPEILKLYPDVPIEIFLEDKDQTDMELAISAADSPSMKKIVLFGATGNRTDHALANLHLMCRSPAKICIETEAESIFCLQGKNKLNSHEGQTISLIPIDSPPTGVTTIGLKWELHNATLDKNFFSQSNICLGSSFEISIEHGNLICCMIR